MKSFNIKSRQYYIHVAVTYCPNDQAITYRRGRVLYVQNFNSPVFFFFSNTYVTMSDVVFKPQKCWVPKTDLSVRITVCSSAVASDQLCVSDCLISGLVLFSVRTDGNQV